MILWGANGLLGCCEKYLFLENARDIMPSRYLDKKAEDRLFDVIEKHEHDTGVTLTRSQAIEIMYNGWKAENSLSKIRIPEGSLEKLQRR